jgi:multidrug efflux system outer membrane protein
VIPVPARGSLRATLRAQAVPGLVALAGLGACAMGPDYQRPALDLPAAWATQEPWHAARPGDEGDRGSWWVLFGDARLDALEIQALKGNQGLAVAAERLEQARGVVTVAAASLFPQLNATAGAARTKISADRPRAVYALANSSTVQNDLSAGFSVHYEADLFGANRRRVESARATEQQAQADLANAHLVLTAEVAADYFALRELDAEIDVVRQNIDAQRRALDFVTARHDMGVASGLDLAQQQSQLDSTITQIDLLRVQREKFEHALARLAGVPAPGFSIAPMAAALAPPAIPLGVPADILQRRPDVASAERAMASANAQIGVAKAAYFPSVALNAAYGVESNAAASLLSAPSALWSLGTSALQPLFDVGRIRANTEIASAGYRAAMAAYRDTVLGAMQEVQDGLSGSANLARASDEARAAVGSAQRVVELASDRYTGGLATYLDVVTAQQSLLANQRLQVQINGQQQLVAVYLVKALGGGWSAPALMAQQRP